MNPRAGILQREIIRQAFLIAARDELGLRPGTRCWANGSPVREPRIPVPKIHTISGVDGLIRVVIRPGEAAAQSRSWTAT